MVAGDELAQLVDEGAEAGAPHHRRQDPRRAPDVDQGEDHRDQHQQPPPQHVGDVQLSPANLGEAGGLEVGPDPQQGGHGRDEHRLQGPPGTHPADEAEARRAVVGDRRCPLPPTVLQGDPGADRGLTSGIPGIHRRQPHLRGRALPLSMPPGARRKTQDPRWHTTCPGIRYAQEEAPQGRQGLRLEADPQPVRGRGPEPTRRAARRRPPPRPTRPAPSTVRPPRATGRGSLRAADRRACRRSSPAPAGVRPPAPATPAGGPRGRGRRPGAPPPRVRRGPAWAHPPRYRRTRLRSGPRSRTRTPASGRPSPARC